MRLVIAALLLSFCGLTASEPPIPSHRHDVSQPNQGASRSQGNTSDRYEATSPLRALVETGSSPVRVEVTAKTDKPNDYTSSEWSLVFLTALLAAATIVLAIYTACLYRSTSQIATDAANTAKSSVKMTTAVERAYLFIQIDGDMTSTDGKLVKDLHFARVKIKNLGKTPAVMTDFSCDRSFGGSLPTSVPQSDEDHIPKGLAIEPGGVFPYEQPMQLTAQELSEVGNLNAVLCIAGRVRYLDAFQEQRETVFCWQWYPHMNKWGIANNHDLNHYT